MASRPSQSNSQLSQRPGNPRAGDTDSLDESSKARQAFARSDPPSLWSASSRSWAGSTSSREAYTHSTRGSSSGLPPASGSQDVPDLSLQELSLSGPSPSAALSIIDRDFRQRNRDFYQPGRVFMVQSEPGAQRSGDDGDLSSHIELPEQHGQRRFSTIQRYVVINAPSGGREYFHALPIGTYGNHGVEARGGISGPIKRLHGIIYSGREAPEPAPEEQPSRGERGMCAPPIRIQTELRTERLPLMSRVNYGTVHRLPVSQKSHSIGWVHDRFLPTLFFQFRVLYPTRPDAQRTTIAENTAGVVGEEEEEQRDEQEVEAQGDEQEEDHTKNDDRGRAQSQRHRQALQAGAAYNEFRAARYSHENTIDLLVRQMMQAGVTRQAAEFQIRDKLNYFWQYSRANR